MDGPLSRTSTAWRRAPADHGRPQQTKPFLDHRDVTDFAEAGEPDEGHCTFNFFSLNTAGLTHTDQARPAASRKREARGQGPLPGPVTHKGPGLLPPPWPHNPGGAVTSPVCTYLHRCGESAIGAHTGPSVRWPPRSTLCAVGGQLCLQGSRPGVQSDWMGTNKTCRELGKVRN